MKSSRRLHRSCCLTLLVGLFLLSGATACAAPAPREGVAQVVRVHDGDTITVRIGRAREKVRLIGIDTAELDDGRSRLRDLAYAAREYAQARLGKGTVKLVADPLCADRDAYGRLLRYVVLADGTDFNKEMVRKGYARVYTRFRFSRSRQYRAAEREARREELGRWAARR